MKKIILFTVLLLFSLATAQNQAGIDESFNHEDALPMFNLNISQTITQPDGKIIVVGGFTRYYKYNDLQNANISSGIVRLNSDLTIDGSFTSGLGFTSTSGVKDVTTAALQADGKILVGGNFTSYNGTPIKKIIRLNNDGSIDSSFNNAGVHFPEGYVSCIRIQSDGKILVTGGRGFEPGTILIRLNADGSLDNSFTMAGSLDTRFSGFDTVQLLPNGKILAGGYSETPLYGCKLFLFNNDGSLDPTFNMDALPTRLISVAVQPDNKILIVKDGTSAADDSIIRLNTDGTTDASFNTGSGFKRTTGKGFLGSLAIQSNGDLIVLGNFSQYNGIDVNNRVRISSNGTIDPTFNNQNMDSNDRLSAISVQPDGSLLACFYVYTLADFFVRHSFVRLDADGFVINNRQLITTTKVSKIVKKSDSEIMVVGSSDFSFNLYHNGIKRVDQNGNMAYNDNLKAPLNANNNIKDAVVQPDGKVLFIGKLPQNTSGNLTRLNADFSVDPSFNLDTGLTSLTCSEVKLQADGKILVSCKGIVAGETLNRVVRLNGDGSIDSSFALGLGTAGFTSEIKGIIVQTDGKILVCGIFNAYNGVPKKGILRLNTDGTLDNGFDLPSISWFTVTISEMAVQSDAKIIISTDGFGLYRLNSDGTVDTSFTNPTPSNGNFKSIAVQADGKILIGGAFAINGQNLYFARINSDGSLDTTFDTGTGFNEYVNSIVVEEDGKILVGGNFTKYNDTYCNGTVRLNGTALLSTNQYNLDSNYFAAYPNPATNTLNISHKENVQIVTVEIYDLIGKRINTISDVTKTIDVSALKSGTYILRINSEKGISNTKFIKL